MLQRIMDLLIVISISITVTLFEVPKTGEDVVVVLLCFFFAFLSMLYKKSYHSLIVCIIILFVSFYFPSAFCLFPIVVYPLMERVPYEKIIARKTLNSFDWTFLIGAIITISVMALVLISKSPLVLIPFVLSLLIGIKTSYSVSSVNRLQEALDDVRFAAIEESRKRIEEKDQMEERVYMATLEERNRIAREIHDNIGHMLTRSIVQMEAIRILNKDESIGGELDSVHDTLNDAMIQVRRSVHELHNESIDLSISLNEIANSMPDSFRKKVNTLLDSGVPNDMKNAIIAIVKEATTNIVKHSSGDRVKIELIENNTFFRLSIEDNGKCDKLLYEDSTIGDMGGIGLINIADRVKSFGGHVVIMADEKGFRVICTLPKKEK